MRSFPKSRGLTPITKAKIAFGVLRLLGFGMLVGTLLGVLACYHLSNGNAASHFYFTYGVFGAAVGALGSIVAAVFIGIMRWENGIANRRPTRTARKTTRGAPPSDNK